MKLYLVEANGVKRYAGTQADSRKAREEVAGIADCKKNQVTISEVDVQTSKQPLIELLNSLCKESERG